MAATVTDPLVGSPWWPKTEAQRAALESKAEFLLFGGSAGSLKSHTLCLDAVLERQNPNLRSIFFRESYPQLADLLEKQQTLYRPLGATYNEQKKIWRFPSGAQVRNGYLSSDRDVYEYWGHQFSNINFDESTRFTEYQMRTVISRLRSTDPSLFLRVRNGTNPGGVGASYHIPIFLRGHCPVHEPELSAAPGKIYNDAVWPSDSTPIPLSTAFIPGKLSDHNLLGERYSQLLKMQSGALSAQLETGCWCSLEGSYFAGAWDKNRCVVPLGSLNFEWWDSFFCSIDYGYGKSSAAGYLHVKLRDGRIATVGEFVAAHQDVESYAKEFAERFFDINGQRRRITVIYTDPAHSQDKGLGHTVSDQINQVFQPYGFGCTDADNDRIGGWQLMYSLLRSGQWVIADNCPKLIESIPSRMHDDKKPGDIKKVPGDPLDDAADSARYGLLSFVTASDMPRELKMKQAFENSPDDTSAVMNLRRVEIAVQDEDQPIYTNQRPTRSRMTAGRFGRR